MKTMTRERLMERLLYDPVTGIFTWKAVTDGRKHQDRLNRNFAGKPAGSLNINGYWRIRMDGTEWAAHRLAWLYVHGEWPPQFLDHIDGDRENNAISNLRCVGHADNSRNIGMGIRNSTGVMGVYLHKRSNNFKAKIVHHGKEVYLGMFPTIEEAAAARSKAAAKLGFHENHGRMGRRVGRP